MTFGESTSSKLLDFWMRELLTFSVVPGDGIEML
jgi:hypothetical protein